MVPIPTITCTIVQLFNCTNGTQGFWSIRLESLMSRIFESERSAVFVGLQGSEKNY